MRIQKLISVFLGVVFFLGAGALLARAAQEPQATEEFTAWVDQQAGVMKAGMVTIKIERWSTPEERAELTRAFKQGGQDEMFKVLQRLPKAGVILFPETPAYDLRYAYQFPAKDGGRTIVIGTDRKIARDKVTAGSPSMDYPFELIQMLLDAKGEGEGHAAFGVKISVSKDGSGIELESYVDTPMMLKNIKTKIKEVK
jgi:hypothetical protein